MLHCFEDIDMADVDSVGVKNTSPNQRLREPGLQVPCGAPVTVSGTEGLNPATLPRPPRAARITWLRPPAATCLMVDGVGDPRTTPDYADAVQALYGLAYTLRFSLKTQGQMFRVGPLEGLWWADDMQDFRAARRDAWRWTMLIALPSDITPDQFMEALAALSQKGRPLPALERGRLGTLDEGECAQLLHIGPYTQEATDIARLHQAIHEAGGTFDGRRHKHHEIYLSDPRRTAEDRLKTVLRQPFIRTGGSV